MSSNVPSNDTRNTWLAVAAGLFLIGILQVLVGFRLALGYKPTLADANASTAAMRSSGLDGFLASFHYWGSAALILGCALYFVVAVWMGQAHRTRLLASIVALGALSFAMQVTGNLLPMEAHDVQTVVIEADIAGRMPFAGEVSRSIMLGGNHFGQPTIDRWFLAHRWLLAIPFAILCIGCWWRLRHTALRSLASVIPLGVVLAAAFVPGPSGRAATANDFTQADALVSWYTWPLHAGLKAVTAVSPSLGALGAAVVPTLIGTVVVLSLWIGRRSPARAKSVVTTGALAILGLSVAFGGGFAPLTGLQDPPTILVNDQMSPIDPDLAQRGRDLFNTEGCTGCHGIDGTKSDGAPDLTKVHERYPTQGFYLQFIKNPTSLRPSTTMPAFEHLNTEQLRALADYLRSPSR